MEKISFVFQNSKLFKTSLRENLLLGKPLASEEEIKEALVNSGSLEIVNSLKNGLWSHKKPFPNPRGIWRA